jgi:hypothetical protein
MGMGVHGHASTTLKKGKIKGQNNPEQALGVPGS